MGGAEVPPAPPPTTRDPATKRIQNSLFLRRVVTCIPKLHNYIIRHTFRMS